MGDFDRASDPGAKLPSDPRAPPPTLGMSRSHPRSPRPRSFVNHPQRASLMLGAFTT